MANESITDDIIRDFFKTNELYKKDKIIIEKQSTKSKKIDKLLKNASKSGNGKGYPDFIIQYKENPNFIIVIESKADTKKHKSDTLDRYKNFAVDGVLLYSSFLSKEYDILAIAVSGEDKDRLKISHYLQLKNTKEAHRIFNNDTLLTLSDYENGYKTDERKFNQDFQKLLKYSKTLNDKLHTLKVKESERSLLISGTLIALTDDDFRMTYRNKKPEKLAKFLITTIEEKLTNVQNGHIKNIISSYSFIKTHTILSVKENELRDIIDEIDEKINNFIKTYKYFDTLGQFYIEFLRYANNDKGLGIVITPPHITELFSEIANINKDSVVLDTCTGTGGFLISAMRQMILDAGGDIKKELEIKSNQIIGVEIQHDIFSLVCSNMYIHGDGRSNLIKGGCFDEKVKDEVKLYKPNVGFLNPPYKSSKDDIEELEFILNNLQQLEKGSLSVAIVPMRCAIYSKGYGLELKEKLLNHHTLEAVFSMPDSLFHNSNVGVNTCIIVFRAKEKHPHNYKTYFAYWKDDGFVKIKNKGRVDFYNTWDEIKQYWLVNYKNRDEILGHSIKKTITSKDEWSVEVYMKTDYKIFEESLFKKNLHNFVSFKFNQNIIDEISKTRVITKKYDLREKKWKYFTYTELFGTTNILRGKRLVEKDREKGKILYFSASEFNNGCTDKISNPLFTTSDAIIYTTFGDAYYVDMIFTASDEVSIFKHENLNVYNGIFIATIISQNKYKYYFGRKAFKNKFINDFIALPIDDNSNLDWEFMTKYMQSLPYSSNL